MDFKDYYKILEVDKKATTDQIKKNFRKFAQKYHPDKNPNDKTAENKFKEINEAYEVLSDPEKRKKYDNLGSSYNNFRESGGNNTDFNWNDWFNQSRQQSNTGNYSSKSNSRSSVNDFFANNDTASDFFEKIFGGGFTGRKKAAKQPQKGENIIAKIDLTLEEAYKGAAKPISINGKTIEVKFKPGIENNQSLKISNKGMPGKNAGPSGDLIINVEVKPHKRVERKGNDLYTEIDVDLYKAILGGTAKIITFAGTVNLNIPAESQQGKTLMLKGLGMPIYSDTSKKGDLYVKLNVLLPQNLSEKEKELFTELQNIIAKNNFNF